MLDTATTLKTNIKGLPEGRTYWTERGYSQLYPWVEIRRTAKRVWLAKVEVKPDPDWKPEIIAGGFAGHCTNQAHQTWLFDKIDETRTTMICLTSRGWQRGPHADYLENRADYFYDYNF